jgi:hypothetical protein
MIDPIVRWCEQQLAFCQRRLEKLQSGKLRMGEIVDEQMVDTTPEEIETTKSMIAELEALLGQHSNNAGTR